CPRSRPTPSAELIALTPTSKLVFSFRHQPSEICDKVGPGCDPQLHEHLAQVVVDRPRAEIQLRGDLLVRQSVRHEPSDLQLLWREIAQRGNVALTGRPPGRAELDGDTALPRRSAEPAKKVERLSEMHASLRSPPLPAKPLAVQHAGASPLERRQLRLEL